MSGEKSIFEACINLSPLRLYLDGSLIGKTIPFTFRNIRYRICFPDFEIPSKAQGILDPKPKLEGTKILLDWINGTDGAHKSGIGRSLAYTESNVKEFIAGCIIVQSCHKITARQGRRAKQELLSWKELFSTWLEILADHSMVSSSADIKQNHAIESYMVSSRVRKIKKRNEQSVSIRIRAHQTLSLKQIKKALRHTQNGTIPPIAYQLLLNGRRHFEDERYREALFEASTALELAMTDMLRSKIQAIMPEHASSLMENYRQINGLFTGLMTLGIILPSDIKTKVGTPRNKAIHGNYPVDHRTAKDALNTVRSFLEQFYGFK